MAALLKHRWPGWSDAMVSRRVDTIGSLVGCMTIAVAAAQTSPGDAITGRCCMRAAR